MRCFKCGASEENTLLFDAVLDEGIQKICKKCALQENVPVIKKSFNSFSDPTNSRVSVYERMASAARINPEKHLSFDKRLEKSRAENRDEELKKLVNANIGSKFKEGNSEKDLIRNFHWIMMRARRSRKMSHGQLARELAEPEETIKMIERGMVPEDYFEIVRKIELFLGVRLLSPEVEKNISVSFDPIVSRVLTIEDLREMQNQNESMKFNYSFKEDLGEKENSEPTKPSSKGGFEESHELSQKEMDDIIFGRKS